MTAYNEEINKRTKRRWIPKGHRDLKP